MTDGKNEVEGRSEDFLLPEFEDVVLPSGLKARLRPPNDLEFHLRCGSLPGRLASIARGDQPAALNSEEILEWTWKTISLIFVHPKFSLTPQEGEFHPNRLSTKDRHWLNNWANKYLGLGGGGDDLKTFRSPEPGAAHGPGASGEDVPLPTERVAEGDGPSLGD